MNEPYVWTGISPPPAALFPCIQFFDANGIPLAGGLLYAYAAGTTTPQAAFTDSTGGSALPNPVVLDSAGRAFVWLGELGYKLALTDRNGVPQWTVDNVSACSLAQLNITAVPSLAVTGDETVGGNLTVGGTVSASTLQASGGASVGASLSVGSNATVAGNETVGGTLGVAGATTLAGLTAGAAALASLTVGGSDLAAIIAAAIPAAAFLSTRTDTGYFIVTIPLASGHLEIGFASGVVANGGYIPLPGGFNYANMAAIVSSNNIRANSSNNNDSLALETSAVNSDGSVTLYQQGTSGTRWPVAGAPSSQSANWLAILWRTY